MPSTECSEMTYSRSASQEMARPGSLPPENASPAKARTQGTEQSCVPQGRVSAPVKTCFVN